MLLDSFLKQIYMSYSIFITVDNSKKYKRSRLHHMILITMKNNASVEGAYVGCYDLCKHQLLRSGVFLNESLI